MLDHGYVFFKSLSLTRLIQHGYKASFVLVSFICIAFFISPILAKTPVLAKTFAPPLITVALAEPAPIALLSHRAVYDLSLSQNKNANSVVSAQGRMAFDFTGSPCEGYTTNFRQVLELSGEDGTPRVSDLRYSTFEDGIDKSPSQLGINPDGAAQSYHFNYVNRQNNAVQLVINGFAERAGQNKLAVSLTAPKEGHYEADGTILFPTEHQIKILEAARRGEHGLSATVYDGSEDGGHAFKTFTVIGAARTDAPKDDTVFAKAPFETMRHWPVSISYFSKPFTKPRADAAENTNEPANTHPDLIDQPDYVQQFDLYDNGAIRSPEFDYGSFKIVGKLTKLEILPQNACQK